MYYTVSQFVERLGVGRETLRHYEHCGLMRPQRYRDNNYRLYSDMDGLAVMRIKLMQSYQLSLQEIGARSVDNSLAQQEAHLEAVERRLEQQLQHIQAQLVRVRKNRSFVREAMAEGGGIVELDTYGIYKLMMFGEGTAASRQLSQVAAQWIKRIPIPDIGWHIPLQGLLQPGDAPVATQIGLMVLPRFVDEYSLSIREPVYFFPAGRSIRMMLHTRDPFHVRPSRLKPLFDYAGERGYRIVSDVSGRYSGCAFEKGVPRYCFSARVLVEPSL